MSQFFHQHVTLFNPQGETLVARCSMENPGRETKVSVLKKYKTKGAKSHTNMNRNLQHCLGLQNIFPPEFEISQFLG